MGETLFLAFVKRCTGLKALDRGLAEAESKEGAREAYRVNPGDWGGLLRVAQTRGVPCTSWKSAGDCLPASAHLCGDAPSGPSPIRWRSEKSFVCAAVDQTGGSHRFETIALTASIKLLSVIFQSLGSIGPYDPRRSSMAKIAAAPEAGWTCRNRG